MSVNDEENAYHENGDLEQSFWSLRGYAPTASRVTAGYNLTELLSEMVLSRAKIEAEYALALRNFSERWFSKIGSSKEYGTHEAAWKGVFEEAERSSALHFGIRDKLMTQVNVDVKGWQKEAYKKALTGLKERKDIDTGFEKAQKPWEKRLVKVNKSKAEYHKYCKQLRTAEIQDRNQQQDTSISEDQKRKNIQKVNDLEELQFKARAKYEQTLKDIGEYNSRYMEDMTDVFTKCQNMEAARHDFFKRTFFKIHQVLDISSNPELQIIYTDLHHTINAADSGQDLTWWSHAHGVDMPMNWPEFENYMPQQVPLNKRASRKAQDGIYLVNVAKEHPSVKAQRPVIVEDKHEYIEEHEQPTASKPMRQTSYEPELNPFASDDGHDLSDQDGGDNTPFDLEQDDEVIDQLSDDGRPGVQIRALYDYEGDEEDELTFSAGAEFEKLEDEDEQGWCKGRLNGRVGLYPANYCVEI